MFVTEETRTFYAASGREQGSTVAAALILLEVLKKLKQKKKFAPVFWVPAIWVLSPPLDK